MTKGDKTKNGISTTALTKNYSASDETSASSSKKQKSTSAFRSSKAVKKKKEPQGLHLPELSKIIIERYEGEKSGELCHGEVVVYFQDGHVYKGHLADGLMHGYGEYTWADGVQYRGDFAANVPTGHGAYTWLDGSTYEGEIRSAMRYGTGTYNCAKTATHYKGEWLHGKRHGKGTIYFNQEATCWYEGDWKNNQREGRGIYCYSSGNTYQGQWKNNVRHGEGTMKWIQLGQEYSGQWKNGIQHGHGTHTWFLMRVRGSQYPLRNEYKGEFCNGMRHGYGTFFYASGAIYTGDWKHNKKHGQGKIVFKNGLVYDGELIDDRMVELQPTSDNDDFSRGIMNSVTRASLLGPDMALNIEGLLNQIPEAQRDQELNQVEYVILRHSYLLRELYNLYSRLGHAQSADNTFILSRMQFWRFLKDCSIHQHGVTLVQMDRFIADASPEDLHSPFSTILLRKWLSNIIIAAYHIYHKDFESSQYVLAECFSKLVKQNIIPNAKNIKGPFFWHPCRAVVGMSYTERCWEIYKASSKATSNAIFDKTMDARGFIWLFKDLELFDTKLTTARVLEILSLENPAISNSTYSNLDLEITFLEFFEALLGCAETKMCADGTTEHTQDCPDETLGTSSSCVTTDSPHLSQHKAETKSPSHVSFETTNETFTEMIKSEETPITGAIDPEPEEPVKDQGCEELLKDWILTVNQFFSHTFFPIYEYNLLLKKEAQKVRSKQSAKKQTP